VVLQDKYEDYCMRCNKMYTSILFKWCRPCQIKDLKENFINWTSGNDKIDDFIQEKQLNINNPQNTIFEWIPYNQFFVIEEIYKDDFFTIYSAKWKNGPLFWNKKYIRESDKKVTLKCLYNLQNIDEFLIEV